MNRLTIALSLMVLFPLAGCAKPSEEASTPEPVEIAVAPEQAPVSAPEPQPEPEPGIELPEGLPAVVHVFPKIKVTEVITINAGENQYEIKGETDSSTVQVLNYYIKYFRENGWEEDMLMEHEGNTVVSFKKDGILQYVDSVEGGYGCYVTITTGNV